MRPGQAIEHIHDAGQSDLAWVWPHELAWFARDVAQSGLIPVLGTARDAPRVIQETWQALADRGISYDTARQFTNLDAGTWQEMFRRLGVHEELNAIRPDIAYWCRRLAGMPRSDNEPRIPLRASTPDDRVDQIIKLVMLALGIIVVGTAVVSFLVSVIIAVAAKLDVLFPWAIPVITKITVILIALLLIGWAIGVLLTIIGMIVVGIFIFFTWQSLPAGDAV